MPRESKQILRPDSTATTDPGKAAEDDSTKQVNLKVQLEATRAELRTKEAQLVEQQRKQTKQVLVSKGVAPQYLLSLLRKSACKVKLIAFVKSLGPSKPRWRPPKKWLPTYRGRQLPTNQGAASAALVKGHYESLMALVARRFSLCHAA